MAPTVYPIDSKIVSNLDSFNMPWASNDPSARNELEKKIADTGKSYGLISYSDLVEGVEFNIPAISPNPHFIRTYDWQGLDRAILGEYLGYLNREIYKKAGFFSSALVIGRESSKPSEIFFDWMNKIGVIPDKNEDTILKFWADNVNMAHRYYNGK